MLPNRQLFSTPRVVVATQKSTGIKQARLAVAAVAHDGDSAVSFDYWLSNDPTVMVESDITVDPYTGIIKFSTLEQNYYIRTLREEDGTWLSRYKTPLPVEALKSNIAKGLEQSLVNEDGELLYATVFAGDDVVVGLIYDNDFGKFARIGGEWILLSDAEPEDEDMIVIPIDVEKADELITLFDEKILTIETIKPYEAPAAE
jgi:hypothetical protein